LEDNQAAIAMASNRLSSTKTRHIKVRYHYIRELVQTQEIELVYCPTEEQIADIFTKPLPKDRFLQLRKLLLQHD
jgi:KUP system potassium uptake protein